MAVNIGNKFKYKTKKIFQDMGYHVEYLEHYQTLMRGAKTIMFKRDILGADGISLDYKETIIWNSVLGKTNISKHKKRMLGFPRGGLKRVIVVWESGVSKPNIIDIDE